MLFCPACRSEFRDGFTRCPDCDRDLVAELPAAPAEADVPSGDWTEIFRGAAAEADVLRSALEAADIETLSPDAYVSTLGFYAPGSWNFIRVFVRTSDLSRAREAFEGPHPPAPEP